MEAKLFARYEDGSYPVLIGSEDFTIVKPTGPLVLKTKRQLIASLTQRSDARNWTFDRYFRQGRWETSVSKEIASTGVTVFDMFPPSASSVASVKRKEDVKLGVDLAKRGHEVKKLFFAGFGMKIRAAGYDPEDVLQDIYKGILIRNMGKCPFDARKASFGHYVHLVIECIVSNYHRKASRQRRIEPIADANDELVIEHAEGRLSTETIDLVADDLESTLDAGDAEIYPLMRAGFGRTEIAEKLHLGKADVSARLARIRNKASEWL